MVAAFAQGQVGAAPRDVHVMHLQLSRHRLDLTPMFTSASEGGGPAVRRRVLFVVECDQVRLRQQVKARAGH